MARNRAQRKGDIFDCVAESRMLRRRGAIPINRGLDGSALPAKQVKMRAANERPRPKTTLRHKGKILLVMQYSRRFGKTLVHSMAKRHQATVGEGNRIQKKPKPGERAVSLRDPGPRPEVV